jgi:hypothetical protein
VGWRRWFGSTRALRELAKAVKGDKSEAAKKQLVAAKATVAKASIPFAGVEKVGVSSSVRCGILGFLAFDLVRCLSRATREARGDRRGVTGEG